MKPCVQFVIGLALACCCLSVFAGESEGDDFTHTREIRAVETYVPYDEFLKLRAADASATIMTLQEYRALVELATARNGLKTSSVPPPVDTSLIEAHYKGVAGEGSVRFDAQFKFSIAGEGWKRCDLGTLQNLGHVLLDGEPGWVLLENGRSSLLVRGAGLHSGTFAFALPLRTSGEQQSLSGELPPAAASQMSVTVPGRVAPKAPAVRGAQETPLDVNYDAAAEQSSFFVPVIAWGKISNIAVNWKRKFDARKSPALLLAEHQISYLLQPANPAFYWKATVQISRAAPAEFEFVEPPGCTVVRVSGSKVHSWRRENGHLFVLPDEGLQGELSFMAAGYLEPLRRPEDAFELGVPKLLGARRNSAHLIFYEASGVTTTIVKNDGLRELSLGERALPAIIGYSPVRMYFAESENARASVLPVFTPAIFDTQTSASLILKERQFRLDCVIAVQPERGRLYTLKLSVPSFWKVALLAERRVAEGPRGLHAEQTVTGNDDEWTLTLNDAADAAHPFEFSVTLQPRDADILAAPWTTSALAGPLPAIRQARKTSATVALLVQPSLELTLGLNPDWHSAQSAELVRVGLNAPGLRAGLVSDIPGAELKLNLRQRPSRGEYESLTHVLARERELWVRADLRVVVLDHALDELTFILPADAPEPITINGEGVREVIAGSKPGTRVARFEQSWQGARQLRVEYRAPLEAGKQTPVPDIQLAGNFSSKRGIIFQTAGVVSLEVLPGASLLPAALDEQPDFAVPFKSGRTLFAYRFSPGGQSGFILTRNLEHSTALGIFASEMNLTTVLDASGTVHTGVDFLLKYARMPYVQIRLPAGSRLVALQVDGVNVRPVSEARGAGEARSQEPAEAAGGQELISVPLPSRSQARLDMVLENSLGALGAFGSLALEAPQLAGVPVGSTKWNVFYPADYRFDLRGGNCSVRNAAGPYYFGSDILARLSAGSFPPWSTWHTESVQISTQQNASVVHSTQVAQAPASALNIKSLESQTGTPERDGALAASTLLFPEGPNLFAEKLGGSARLELSYRNAFFAAFSRHAVFLGAIVVGIWLLLRRGLRVAAVYAVVGLLFGVLVPAALEWRSPLLWIPFCEGLTALAALLAVLWLLLFLKSRRAAPTAKSVSARSAYLAWFGVLALGTAGFSLSSAGEEAVLIPFGKNDPLPLESAPEKIKAYVPKSVFLNLMERITPRKKTQDELQKTEYPQTLGSTPAIVPISLGNADYEATVQERGFSIKGTLEAQTFNPKGWARLFLDTGATRLTALAIDGVPAGISNENGRPYVVLKGAGKFKLELALQGALQFEAGRAGMTAQIVPGGATRVVVQFPANAEPDTKALPPGAWIALDAATGTRRCEVQLGSSGLFTLHWHSSEISAPGKTQFSALAYTRFDLQEDGYAVSRAERVSTTGTALEQWSYLLSGDWEVQGVSAPGLIDWTVTGEGAARHLRLWFRQAQNEVVVNVAGWAPLPRNAGEVPAAGMSLEGALRQEGFIGLKHGGGRRFLASSLGELKRAALEELSAALGVSDTPPPDRILHYFGSIENSRVAVELEPLQTALETQFTGVFRNGSLLVAARTQYISAGLAPLRYQVELPAGWNVRTVRCNALRSWEIRGNAGTQRLVVEFNGRAVSGTEVLWSADAALPMPAAGPLQFEVPVPYASAALKAEETLKHGESSRITENIEWVLASEPALDLSQAAATTMQSEPVERAAHLLELDGGASYRLAFRSVRTDSRLALEISRRAGTAQATIVSFVRATEEFLQINARCRFKLTGAGRERFTLRLPPGAELINMSAANLREKQVLEQPGGTVLTALMQSPVTGEQSFDVSYRMRWTSGTNAVAAPLSADPQEVQASEHFAGLLQMDGGLVELAGSRGLIPLKNFEELPFVPDRVSAGALALVFAAEPGWSMTLRRPGVKPEIGQPAEVVFAELKTALSADGTVRTMATYSVRNRSLQFLPIALPEDARLWAVFVGGLPSTVSHELRQGAQVLLVPLQRMGQADLPVKISLVYESARLPLPAAYSRFVPQAPRVLDAPVAETYWTVYVPAEYEVSRAGGNMKEVLGSVLYGGKLKSNIGEIERLAKLADAPDQSSASKARALGSLLQLQQELDDNVSALGNAGNDATEGYLRRNRQEEVQSQLLFNADNMRQGNAWQGRLNERGRELAAARDGQDNARNRLFLDNFYFLENRWRPGKIGANEALPPGPSAAQISAADLLFQRRPGAFPRGAFSGLFNLPVSPLTKTAPASGLLDERRDEAGMESGLVDFKRFEDAAQELRMTTLTFSRSVEGQPELELSLRSTRETLRWAAMLALLVLAAAAVFLFRRRRSRQA